MPGALNTLAHGINKLGNTIVDLEVQRRKEVMELELRKDIQQYQTDMSRADDEYMQAFQGKDALDAEEQSIERYKSGMEALAAKWNGNAFAQTYIQAHAGGLAVAGVDRMRGYRNLQQDKFRASVNAGDEALFLKIAHDPNSSPEEIEAAWREYAPKSIEYQQSKGLDTRAAAFKTEEVYRDAMADSAANRVYAAIETGNFSEAERLLKGTPRYERLPADVKDLAASVAKAEGVPAELLMAVITQESGGNQAAVSKAGARGLAQLMPETAKELGVDPDDPKQNVTGGARYLRLMLEKYKGNIPLALMAYNWGPGNVDAYLKTGRGKAGQEMPKEAREYAGRVLGVDAYQAKTFLDPQKRLGLEARLETARKDFEKRQETAAIEFAFASLSDKISVAPGIDDQDIIAGKFIGEIKEQKIAKGVKTLYDAQRSVKELQQKAQDTVLGMEFRQRATQQNITPAQAEYMDKPNGFSESGWEKAKKSLHKSYQRPTSKSWGNYNSLLRSIDLNEIKDNTDIDAFAFDNSLTDAQIEKARAYLKDGGNIATVTFSKVERIYKNMGKMGRDKAMPDEFYDLVIGQIEPGKPVHEDQLRKIIANVYMDGESRTQSQFYWGYGEDETYREALESGRGDTWLPDVDAENRKRIIAELKEKGITLSFATKEEQVKSERRIREYFKYERGMYSTRGIR
ncbi:MAG: lytic transglycosylase domain-containing protein [Desulfovibrio sp.]|nr:lytic transglycosylase domain-containing protein [Desulfovibrio sp.]